jgi:hypothetical protein
MDFILTVPDEVSAHAVAERLAQRGHLLVAVRPDTSATGWWGVHSLAVDPPYEGPLEVSPGEKAAVSDLARRYGGRAHWACGQYPDASIRRFWREGLTHELDRAEADQIRERIVAEQTPAAPSLPPAPGLKCGGFRRPGAELRAAEAAIRGVAAPLLPPGAAEGVGDVLAGIADRAFPQGTAGPDTAAAVPALTAVARADGVSDYYRAMALLVLYQMGTAGRRRLAYQESTPAALTSGAETAAETASRAAVVAALPELVARGVGRSELAEFLLAALVAAGPEAGTGMPAALDRIEERYVGTARAPVVTLIRALAHRDEQAIRDASAAVAAALPDVVDSARLPENAVEGGALDLLDTELQWELDNARLPRLGMVFAGPR